MVKGHAKGLAQTQGGGILQFLHVCQGSYLRGVEAQVVAHDVVVSLSGLKTLHKIGDESLWVTQVELLASREGSCEFVLLSEAEQDVEDGAAGSLVGLEEHDVGLGLAGHGGRQQLCRTLLESAGRQHIGKTALPEPYPIS